MAVRSDAANDRLTRTGGAPDPQTGFTVCGWFYLSVDRDDFSTMIRLHASSGSTTRLTLATGSSGTLPAVFTPGNTSGVLGVDSFTAGAWLFVAVTQTGTTATIYTCTPGGTMHSASGTSSGGSAPDGYTIFGRSSSDASEWFNGRAACVRLWSIVLTGTELAAERDSFTAVKTASLYADYRMADAATALTDSGSGARTLTAGSTAVTTEADPPIGTSLTDAGTATLTLGGTGTQTRTAASAATADAALTATGAATTARAGAGSASLALGAAGTTQALRAAAGTADAQLAASGTAVRAAVDAGTAVLTLAAGSAATRWATDAGTATMQLAASGAAAHQATAADTGTLALGGDGVYLHAATAAGSADLALQAAGTVGSGSGQQAGAAVLALDTTGAYTAVRAAATAAVLVLDASGSSVALLPVVDSGAATLVLAATGTAVAARTADGAAVLQLSASGVVSGEQRDVTVTAVLLPSRFSARLLPPRITVKEAAG